MHREARHKPESKTTDNVCAAPSANYCELTKKPPCEPLMVINTVMDSSLNYTLLFLRFAQKSRIGSDKGEV